MFRTFRYATSFNNGGQPMNTRSVTVGTGATARTYNAWDTSSVTSFERGPFENAQAFNQDVSNWDVSNAANALVRGFENAQVFNHYLPWDLNTSANPPVTYYLYNMFNGSGMSTNNYTDTIVYWANFVKNQTPDAPLNVGMNTQGGMTYDENRSGGSNFANAKAARDYLTDTVANGGAGWTISGDTITPLTVIPFKFRVSVPAGTSTTITVPFVTGTDYTVNWGDYSEDNNLNTSGSAVTHTYDGSVTNPEISFGKTGDTGLPTVVSFNKQGSKDAVTEITQWGNLQFTSLNYQFRECTNLTTISATDLPDWSKVTNTVGMYLMFNDAPLNSVHSSMANWDVSMMRSFNQCFGDSTGLNIDLSGWDISGVDQSSGFANMFAGCSSLNFDAGQWTLPTHRSDYALTGMFANCSSFNADLSSWDILNRVTSLSSTFAGCTSFTATNLDQWDISNVTSLSTTFKNCTSITNLDVSNWNTGKVTYMLRTFEGTSNWNPDTTNWDVSKVTGSHCMQEMFENSGFNRNIAGWQLNPNMSGASEMHYMFNGSSMSTANYTDTITGWANYVKNQNPDAPLNIAMTSQVGMTFDSNRSGGANFASAGAARDYLIDTVANGGGGWSISGDTII